MGSVRTFFKLVKNDRAKISTALFRRLNESGMLRILSDRAFLKYAYKAHFGKKLDLKNPLTFNEKLNWLKLYNRDESCIPLVDKLAVKDYIANTIGEKYVVPTLAVWDRDEDIDIGVLPDKFVLKCTHDSGSAVVCRDKSTFDFENARKKLKRKLEKNLFWHGREWPYKKLEPKIIAEAYVDNGKSGDLEDYKLFCFNGKCRCYKVDFDRFTNHGANYFDTEGNLLPFGEAVCPPDFDKKIDIPDAIKEMIPMAEKLSEGYPFVRVDFYEANGNVYFGEMTFFPASGFGPLIPEQWDKTLGDWLILPEKQKKG